MTTIKHYKLLLPLLAVALSVPLLLAGCVSSGKPIDGSEQGISLLAPRVTSYVDDRTGEESDDAAEFLDKVLYTQSKKHDAVSSSTRSDSYSYYDEKGTKLFGLIDKGDGRHYTLTIGTNTSHWTFDLNEQ